MRRQASRATTVAATLLCALVTTMSVSSAQLSPTATIVLVGGPAPLWPEIIAEYARRYPSNRANWEVGTSRSGQADLVFAYYPTREQLRAALPLSSMQWLGFPTEFVAAGWKQPIDPEPSARASAYLDEGGVENGVRLLAYLFSLARLDAPAADPPVKAPQTGIYHPDAAGVFADYDTYRQWWLDATRVTRAFPDGLPIAVAVPFLSTSLRGRDLAAVDAIIRRLEAEGRLPVAVFGYPLDRVTPLLESGGVFQPEIAVTLNATSSSPTDAETYERWGIPVLNGLVTRESAAQWRANPRGLPADRMAAHLSFPERAGLIAPTLVATTEVGSDDVRTTEPFIPGIAAAVEQVQRILALRAKPNGDKRIALIYYDNPAGKGNIGASYLQVFPSLRNILAGLAGDGYDIPEPLPDETMLRWMLETNGRNVELWAEGETQRMAAASIASDMVRWPMAVYRRYYDDLPVEFRTSVEEVWGAPERSRLMTADCPQGRCLLLPVQQQGHVLLAPQPLRTTFEQASDPSHGTSTPPPHQYIAFYLWLQHEWRADALVHLGRHGTLEWLPGKQAALAPDDAVSILLGGLPNFNVYVMDGGGEAIQAKRRGLATLVSHLTPMIWRAGGRADLETLHQSFHTLMDRGDELSPELAADYERVTRAEVVRLGLDRQLNLDMQVADWRAMAPALHSFLHDIENAPVPAGLPIFGQSPRDDQLREAVGAYLFAAFPRDAHDAVEAAVPGWADAFLAGSPIDVNGLGAEVAGVLTRVQGELPAWIQSLRESGLAEMQGLLAALRGAHRPSRLLGDPLRKPEALPTGGNLHAVDAARIPTEAAWRVGQKMADEFLRRYHSDHGASPKRISLVLWYGETERQQGAMESMALALLGVRPIWNQQGILEDLQLIEREQLGRDRVDVVFAVSGSYRDGLADKLRFLDRAVRLAAQGADGAVAAGDRDVAAMLERQGIGPEEAARESQVRIFSARPGAYGVGVQPLVEKSGGGDSGEQIAAMYAANMGFWYTADRWGTASGAALTAHLRTIDAVQFSRSSNLYGSLDNNDIYQSVGGLRTAIAQAAARAPEVYFHDLRQSGAEKMVSLRESLAVELHSRQFNPVWLQGMQKSGYAGAREMSQEIEHLYGFQKTTPDHLDNQTWQTVMDVFVKDRYELGLTQFFEEQNPHARQTVLARLLEVDRQGIQRFSDADRQLLLTEYAESVARDGAACSAQICGNVVLREHVAQELRRNGDVADAAAMEAAFRRTLEKAPVITSTAKPPPLPPVEPVIEWRQLSTYVTAWTRSWPVPWNVTAVPWWIWVGLVCGYAAAATVLARTRRRSSEAPITLRSA